MSPFWLIIAAAFLFAGLSTTRDMIRWTRMGRPIRFDGLRRTWATIELGTIIAIAVLFVSFARPFGAAEVAATIIGAFLGGVRVLIGASVRAALSDGANA